MRARRTVICTAAAAAVITLTPTPSMADPSPTVGQGRIIFNGETENGSQIYSVWPNGTHLRQLTDLPDGAAAPDWSPDGRAIVFEAPLPDDAGAQIAFIGADGGNLRRLDPTLCIDANPAFTPDGQRVVYESYDCDVDDSIFSRNIDGSDPQRVTPLSSNGATDPNVSPDGSRLSYVEFENGVEFRQALVVSDADGSNRHRLTPYSFDVGIKQAWSPDGEQLVFTKDANPIDDGPLEANVAVINADGSGLHVLTNYAGGTWSAFAGSFSPDGRWIVYRLQNNDTGRSALWRMWADGTHRKKIFEQDGLRARNIDWGAPS